MVGVAWLLRGPAKRVAVGCRCGQLGDFRLGLARYADSRANKGAILPRLREGEHVLHSLHHECSRADPGDAQVPYCTLISQPPHSGCCLACGFLWRGRKTQGACAAQPCTGAARRRQAARRVVVWSDKRPLSGRHGPGRASRVLCSPNASKRALVRRPMHC